ncbi:unnamed protein product [Aspergillus oryzae]|uniref:Unnamed protein product n=1 Tax=Aspergillus oryzae var. brunneus TaxID=332754 RepID=A0ABQ6KTP8_ASPOZ|nr:unnamed protein product [Aspergillus oryzae]GMF85016.1 unnamed protein product [Aspergillus oryzae]GMG14600.1 unnamed protein product [Aspergillus oryzae]GMG45786.1 unnamed protein product [Aspergillus oryzae var. brunneus]
MKFAWLLACLSATVLAAPEKRDAGPTTTDSVNWSALGQALYVLAVLVFMRIGIIKNVPPSALAQLVVPAQRSALASEIDAGNTPSWYLALPSDVKSYMSEVKKEMSDGALTATTGKYAPAKATAESTKDGGASSTTSSGMAAAAAKPTGGLVLGGMGALGVLGVALAL